MESSHGPSLKQSLPADDSDSELQLYALPSRSSWFVWDDIHEIEKVSLKEFFDFSSITRSPKLYKEYRDFIISKFREDPSRRLTFSEVRRSLVGDVNYLHQIFSFLERWGLINFGVSSPLVVVDDDDLVEEEERWKVKVEEGPPHGVRVVAVPNSLKPVSLPPSASGNGGVGRIDFRMPPLASHTNVFDEMNELKKLVCGNCKGQCDLSHYESTKEGGLKICMKCFQNGTYRKLKSVDDFKFVQCNANNVNHGSEWTEAEILLLLESMLKHGDDWELVAQSVPTKSRLDCISKLIQLPFGELMLGSAYERCRYWETVSNISSGKQAQVGLSVSLNTGKIENLQIETNTDGQQMGDAESQGPPHKKLCIAPSSDVCSSQVEKTNQEEQQSPLASIACKESVGKEGEPDELKNDSQQNGDAENKIHPKGVPNVSILDSCSSLMKQVARISTMVSPQIVASAAEAAVTALSNEYLCPREIFEEEEYDDELGSSTQLNEIKRTAQGDVSEMDGRPSHSETCETCSEKRTLPIALRVRAATATALGAAAAGAKLLAVQEDREVEHLVASVIDTQMKKLHYKMKLFEKVEVIMEKEFSEMEELEESLLTERMDVIQRVFDAGISRSSNLTSLKPHTETFV